MDPKNFRDICEQEANRYFFPILNVFREWTDAEVLASRQILDHLTNKWVCQRLIDALDRDDTSWIWLATGGKQVPASELSRRVYAWSRKIIRADPRHFHEVALLCKDEPGARWIARTFISRMALERNFFARLEPFPVGKALLLCTYTLESPRRPEEFPAGPKDFPALRDLLTLLRFERLRSHRPAKNNDQDQQTDVLAHAWKCYRDLQGRISPTGNRKRVGVGQENPTVVDHLYRERAPAILDDLKTYLPILEGKTETLPHRVYQALREDWKKWKAAKRTGAEYSLDAPQFDRDGEELELDDTCPFALAPGGILYRPFPIKQLAQRAPDRPLLFALYQKECIEAVLRQVAAQYGKAGRLYVEEHYERGTNQSKAAQKAGISRTNAWRIDGLIRGAIDTLAKDLRDF